MCNEVIYCGQTDAQDMRQYLADCMRELLEQNDRTVFGDADMNITIFGYDELHRLREKYGDRFFDTGIQEANLIGMAAGLSLVGKIPYVHAFSQFITRRAFDQIYLSLSYAKLNARLIGSDPGYLAGYNGGTHTSLEDIGILRTIPDITIYDISDSSMLRYVMKQTNAISGIVYIRTPRKLKMKRIYREDSLFLPGKAKVVCEGRDLCIIACGVMVAKALEAARILGSEGLEIAVVDVVTIKPLDTETVKYMAGLTGAVLSCENHRKINGLSSALAEVIARMDENIAFDSIGVDDRFGEVGPVDYLEKAYGLTVDDICDAARCVIKKRNSTK